MVSAFYHVPNFGLLNSSFGYFTTKNSYKYKLVRNNKKNQYELTC